MAVKIINEVTDPFVGTMPNTIADNTDIIQYIRKDIIGELDAIHMYDAHQLNTDNMKVKEVLQSIRDEEKVHVGELFALLQELDPDEAYKFSDGQNEVEDIVKESYSKVYEDVIVGSADNIDDEHFMININGKEYLYTPKSDSIYSVAELVYKFNGIRTHSNGRALAWIKKYATGEKV